MFILAWFLEPSPISSYSRDLDEDLVDRLLLRKTYLLCSFDWPAFGITGRMEPDIRLPFVLAAVSQRRSIPVPVASGHSLVYPLEAHSYRLRHLKGRPPRCSCHLSPKERTVQLLEFLNKRCPTDVAVAAFDKRTIPNLASRALYRLEAPAILASMLRRADPTGSWWKSIW